MKRALRALTEIKQTLKEQFERLRDVPSDLTGYAAIRFPLRKASRPGEVTLDLTGYKQIDTYSCGAVAAAMVAAFLRPRLSFEAIYAAVDPCKEIRAGTMRVTRALRSLGLRVARRTRLTFDDLREAIDTGCPVLVCVTTSDPFTNHWVVLYGYGRRPNCVFLAGQNWLAIGRDRVMWPDFRRQWAPSGEGLVCSKASPRKSVRIPRTSKKK